MAGGAGSSRGGATLDWPGARGAQRAGPQVSGRRVGAKSRAGCYCGAGEVPELAGVVRMGRPVATGAER